MIHAIKPKMSKVSYEPGHLVITIKAADAKALHVRLMRALSIAAKSSMLNTDQSADDREAVADILQLLAVILPTENQLN